MSRRSCTTLLSVISLLFLQPWGCKGWEKKLDTRRLELAEGATPCLAPATCTEKHHGDGGRDYKVCSAVSGEASYVAGDVVLVHEIGLDMIGLVKGARGATYDVEFADGITTTGRAKASFVGRVCK